MSHCSFRALIVWSTDTALILCALFAWSSVQMERVSFKQIFSPPLDMYSSRHLSMEEIRPELAAVNYMQQMTK